VDSGTGNITFRYIDTGYGPSKDPLGLSSKNGIAYVSSADLDADHITDYVYAGDLFGNLWRFDLTGKTPSSWTVGAKPIFSTTAGQPITTRVLVDSVPAAGTSGAPRVIVSFGTGQQQPQTLTSSSTYATTTGQALYGIWDWNMNAWNALSTSSIPYATLTAPQTVTVAKLQAQSIITSTAASGSTPSYRTVTANPVCWAGSSSCTSGNTQYGWTLPLPATNEQIVYNPVMAYGMFIVNTIVPAVTQVLSCTSQPPSGYTMAVTVAGGGAAAQSFFGDANNNFVSIGGNIVSGIGLSGVGTPSIVTANGQPYLVEQTVSGTGAVSEVNPGANAIGGRLNWTKLR
jgi:type IV pilus assembly protein PilY1